MCSSCQNCSPGMEAFAMWKCIAGWVSHQVRSQRSGLEAAGGFPFAGLLPAARVEQVLQEEGVSDRSPVYTPLVTLWTFLSQVLSADHSCREAVARLRAFLTADGQPPCAPGTGAYCKARQRLPEKACARLACDVGGELHAKIRDRSVLGGRPVKLVDGLTASMPDTPENQAEYPQPPSQKPGLGFPLARMVGLLSLACGAVLDLAIGPYAGKETGISRRFGTWPCWGCGAWTVCFASTSCVSPGRSVSGGWAGAITCCDFPSRHAPTGWTGPRTIKSRAS